MDILAAAPFRAGSIAWQEQPEQWTLTVVCKATYALAPGTSALATEPEDVNERDNHWDDDPRRSVYAPCDLAPRKPHAEVMLVGSAFAPKGEPVHALVVRLIVGELDKSIEVFGPRARALDGALREGPRWTKMPLRYERAAGGPGTWNPAGVEALRPDEQITLENLHPLHARLVTRLAGVRPRARVETTDAPDWELSLVADTLWIDTDRAVATLTWRGQIPVDRPDPPGRVLVGIEEPGRAVRWPRARTAPAEAPPDPDPARDDELIHTAVDDAALAAPRIDRDKHVLPFQSADHGETMALSGRESLAWIGPASVDVVPPPPVATLLRHGDPAIASGQPPSIGARATAVPAYGGVLEASNAAAAVPPELRSTGARAVASSAAPAVPAPPPRALVELLWYDPAKIARIRAHAAWASLLAPPDEARPAPADPEPAEATEQRLRAERADVANVLSRASPAGDLEAVIAGADGAVDPPLALVAGELELPLDEGRMLDVLLGAAASLAAGDKRVEEVVALAAAVMKTPLGASPEVAAGFSARVREAWTRHGRMLPADYLDVHARRILLDQRAYQKRVLWDEEWIRALLAPLPQAPTSSIPAVPTYLPAALARRLPLFARFPARVLAEAVPQQDQHETHPVALRALALARVLPPRQRPRLA